MRKIALIGCASQKLRVRAKAIDMYMPSHIFRLEREYAEKILQVDEIYVLSAKYNLLHSSDEIDTYNMFLGDFTKKEKKLWADATYKMIMDRIKPQEDDEFIFLCGKNYYEFLIDKLNNKCITPLKGLTIGKQIKFLKGEINDISKKY